MLNVVMKYCFNENDQPSESEQKVISYISMNKGEDYSAVIERETDWYVFHQLAKTRESILNWYDFKEEASILEVGSGFGAVTGLLSDRSKDVTCVEAIPYKAQALAKRYENRTNITIYSGDVLDIEFDTKFDYIVMLGVLEYCSNGSKGKDKYIEFISKLHKLLNKNGKILLAAENRYGIRYFCGEKEQGSNTPFYGINRFPNGCRTYAFDRRELTDIIKGSGLEYKMYYPMPDYKHAQVIFSDEYLPQSSLRERIIPYYQDKSTILALEKDLYDDLVDNGVFPFFSNSYLAECGFDKAFCKVDYAALTTDRGKEHGFATVIMNKNKVEKRALYNEGQKNLAVIYDNLLDLKEHGIHIVHQELVENKLTMPYIDKTILSEALKLALRENKNKFIEMFDLLYEQILLSSEHMDEKYNKLRASDTDKRDYGIILKKSYIDMIPVNCFIDESKLIFFDQEFVEDYYPASYTMFRALKYTYSFITFANGIVPLQQMKEKYGLSEVWEDYTAEENKYVYQNRDMKTYKFFWESSRISKKDVSNNIIRWTS